MGIKSLFPTLGQEGSGGTSWPLLIWVEDCETRARIFESLKTLPSVAVRQADSLEDIVTNGQARAVVLSLAASVPSASELEAIRAIKQESVFVLCLVDKSECDLRSRCQLLLAGASSVMDTQSNQFLLEFRGLIARAADEALQEEAGKRELAEIMKQAGFAGRGNRALALFRTLRRVSVLTDLPVLITGETGTGKELVANTIHALDPKRSRHPFVAVNCAALPQHLSESELFGHCRGSFTGAERERQGLFRSADGGVLFLDEIGELSPDLQAKLLRVLQAGRLRGVGSDHEIAINTRVIAATNRCLEQMRREGTFREDLFHRLNVVSLNIPPLRERKEDIETLLGHFVDKHAALWKEKGRPAVDPDFVSSLKEAALPGNARQLENIVCRALIDWDGNGALSLWHLPSHIWQELSEMSSAGNLQFLEQENSRGTGRVETQAITYLQQHNWNLAETIRHLESLLVQGAMMASGGNQSEAARLLGITPRSIYNKLHR